MRLQFIAIVPFIITQVFGYLSEQNAPFTISLVNKSYEFKRGDTVQFTWELTSAVRFPLYGYASARESKTDVGLLAPESSRTQPYLYKITSDLSVLECTYTWTIEQDVPTGKYQIGIGFFYHEVSPEIHIVVE